MTEGAQRARYRRILWFAARQLARLWWFELFLPRIGMSRVSERTRSQRMRLLARQFHTFAVSLGGLMIKAGQFLSSRLDVLPVEITSELDGLQDEVPALPFAVIRECAEAELGAPLTQVFAWFEETPVAAASLGQAHRARLAGTDARDTGITDVIVKVQRPGIVEIVATDLAALRRVGRWLQRVRAVSSRVNAPALVEEFVQTSLEEVDYLHEAANAERFAQNFDGDRISVPAVIWPRSTRRVLTLQDVTAIKINDVDALRRAGIDPKRVATAFAEAMFDQIFTHGFVHADPHPGNVFVTPEAGDPGWRITFIDFGMMAEVPPGLRGGLRSLVVAVATRDGRAMVEAARAIGVLMPTADTDELERALAHLFARFGGMGFAQLTDLDPREFRDFASEFGDLVRALPFQLPEQLLLLIRGVSLTSGVCTALDPEFNAWAAVEPYAERLIGEEAANSLQGLAQQAVTTAGVMWSMPRRIDALLARIDEGSVRFDTARLESRIRRLEGDLRRVISAVFFAAFLIGGGILVNSIPALGIALMSVSVIPLLHALFSGVFGRRGR